MQVGMRRLLTGVSERSVDCVWRCANLMRALLWLVEALAVTLAGYWVVAPPPEVGTGTRIAGVLVAVVIVPLIVWVVGYRSRVAIAGDHLYVVNLPLTYVIPLAQIRAVRASTYGLKIRYWDGSDFDEITAIAIQKPGGASLFNTTSRADEVAAEILARAGRN
jgi:membrane protein YdbS with pleckstrin-like domain